MTAVRDPGRIGSVFDFSREPGPVHLPFQRFQCGAGSSTKIPSKLICGLPAQGDELQLLACVLLTQRDMKTLRMMMTAGLAIGGSTLGISALTACSGDDSNAAAPDGSSPDARGGDTGVGELDGTLPEAASRDGGADAGSEADAGDGAADAFEADASDGASTDGALGEAAPADGRADGSPVDAADAAADSTVSQVGSGDGGADAAETAGLTPSRVIYVETNDTTPNQNGVLAFAQKADGSLAPLVGSPFLTGGTGVGNPGQGLGPDDTDQEILLSADGLHLFAVNAGSNTIAVFDVHADGSLAPISGSPFPSGGIDPVSVGIAGQFLYVVNQDQDPAQDAAAGSPGYFALPLGSDGALGTVVASAPAGRSPQVALTTPNGSLLFGVDFMAPVANGQGPLRAFAIGADGTLTSAPGTPLAIPLVDGGSPPGTPLALGLALHPTQTILYVGFVLRNEIGVYSYAAASGALSYVTNVTVSGPAPCWIRMSTDGSRAYVVTTGDNGVSVLDTSTPLAPSEKEHLILDDRGPFYDAGGMASPTSQSYEEGLSPDGKYLFVLSQRTTLDPTVSTGNVLHVLSVASDGTISETVPDVSLSVAVGVRPQGVAVR
jgi:hypothetical protein